MENQSKSKNPLMSFMRQPKIYISLPSNGEFWPEDSLIISETGEYPVYSMTAKDELLLKVPDALLNGQAVVDVIEHCIPNIKNAWNIPSIDLDVILIALRLATYGEKMKIPLNLDENLDFDYEVDLRLLLDNLKFSISWDPIVTLNDDITVFVKPLTYKQISETALKTFETQKIMNIIDDQNLNDSEKIKLFKESFSKLTEVTLSIVKDSIFKIDSTEGSTDDQSHIQEFLENIDKNMFNAIKNHLDNLKEKNQIQPIKIETPSELKAKGYTEDFIEVPLIFDPSTFFA